MTISNKTSNQRSTYRVGAQGGASEIFVGLANGPVKAELGDVSSRGCGFTLPLEYEPELTEGLEFVVRMLVGGECMPQLFIRAIVRSVRTVEEGVRVGAQFVDTERLYTQLREPQWRFFNRREAFRVSPADPRGRPLRARFHIPGQPEPRSLALYDLSSTGLSVSLRPPNDLSVPKHIPIRVAFAIPEVTKPELGDRKIDLYIRFVHRTSIEGRTRIGFRIDAQNTPELEFQSESILRYVLERQRQLLAADRTT